MIRSIAFDQQAPTVKLLVRNKIFQQLAQGHPPGSMRIKQSPKDATVHMQCIRTAHAWH